MQLSNDKTVPVEIRYKIFKLIMTSGGGNCMWRRVRLNRKNNKKDI